jgi:hydrogenase/urease accessory protein HupE
VAGLGEPVRRRGIGRTSVTRRVASLLVLLFLACLPSGIRAHEVRPGYLELRRTGEETYEVLLKLPAMGENQKLALYVRFPDGVRDVVAPRALFSGGAYIEHRTIRRDGGLTGQVIAVGGLSATLTDVLARVEDVAGVAQTELLTPTRTSFVVKAAPGPVEVGLAYLRLGIGHILSGYDHLLFVLALVLIVTSRRVLVWTITAFTLAHSITLALATLGVVRVPGRPVEATIALSIVLLACEILRQQRGEPGLTARWPWLVAFSFGLLHGFGFAGALSEIGLPRGDIPLALLTFNLGVEVGQLVFIAAVLTAKAVADRAGLPPVLERHARTVAAYAIGGMAASWLLERLVGFWA